MNEIRQLFDIAKMVKAERLNQGLTQAELASRAGVSRRWLIGLEQGELDDARFGNIMKVMATLNIQLHARASRGVDQAKPHSIPAKDRLAPGSHSLPSTNYIALLGAQSGAGRLPLTAHEKLRAQAELNSPLLEALNRIHAQNQSQIEKYHAELTKAQHGKAENTDD